MKNIHLLPTDKPSRLFDFMTALVLTDKVSPNDSGTNHHIYITSDEEIKEGDWVYCNIDNTIDIASDRTNYHRNEFEKIILTTDQDLIKNGVQPIDNEFLEWFVKNPSYEEIKAEYKFIPHNITQDDFCITCDSNGCNLDDKEKYKYKIIIPQEEPKQETLEEFPVHNFMSIEPSNKKQQKELENNRARLGVKNKEEDFVLKCLLSFDWKREVILYEVEKVSFTGNMIDFRVRVKAPHKIVDYCCSNPFKETGWSLERPDFNSRAWEVWSQLNRYLKR
jgi:hypothetical protein